MEGEIRITTPESVHIRFEAAGIGSRFAALMVDTVIQLVLFFILLISLFGAGITMEGIVEGILSWYTALFIILSFLIFMGYFIFFETVFHGRTPGKAMMKIRVIQSSGQPVTFMGSVLRNIFRLADFFPGFYGIGILVMFISSESRRIGDYLAGTVVVRDYGIRSPYLPDPGNERAEGTVNPYPLDGAEYRLLKEFMQRRQEFVPEKREQIAREMAHGFWNRFHVPEEERKDPEAFLELLLKLNG
ncbi:MAG: RDD family protein [Clostridia bacterium]|jgi:uncharacterized RDD family membrane protein YckC